MDETPKYGGKLPWAGLAARQYGLVTRQQLRELGLGAKAIEYRLRVGELVRIHQGVYALEYRRPDPIATAAAAVLAGGPGTALSHFSAAVLWGLCKRWPCVPEITVVKDRRLRNVSVHRSATLAKTDITHHLGISVTSPARTLHDIARRLTPEQLTRAVNDGRVSRYLTLSDLEELVDRLGSPLLAPFVDDGQHGLSKSSFEDGFLRFVKAHGLPTPQTNVYAAGYEVDILYAREKVIIELDSWEHHKHRQAFETDRERDAATLAAGYITVRITWERLKRQPVEEARRLLAILESRRPD